MKHPSWDLAVFVPAALLLVLVQNTWAGLGLTLVAIVALKVRLRNADRARDRGEWNRGVGSKLNHVFSLSLFFSFASSAAIRALLS